MSQDQQIEALLTHGVAQIYPKQEMLEAALRSDKKLRVYQGFDPTGEYLHIGHAFGLRKLRAFQELGHEVILLIGSFTAMIGDPTDKASARVQLTRDQVLANAKTYKEQAAKILSFEGENSAQIKFNDEWLAKMTFEDVVGLASHFTVQQMLERDMFEKRIEEAKPIYLHEFLYPLMQGYDSVAMDVDVEVGGSDQIFNMLAGRTLMKQMNGKEKMVLATSLLTNDEGKKMSKSEGGFIALNDAPEEMYGKVMAMNDSMIVPYFELATDVSAEEITQIKAELAGGANPRDVKARLAREVVALYAGADHVEAAEAHFDSVFRKGETPEEMSDFVVAEGSTLVDVLVGSGLATSKSDARRTLEQGAVKLDGAVVTDGEMIVSTPAVLQKGKRHFVRLTQ